MYPMLNVVKIYWMKRNYFEIIDRTQVAPAVSIQNNGLKVKHSDDIIRFLTIFVVTNY